jgi:MFS family permease
MKRPVKRLLFWAPRILCILFAVFVSLFALDVFGEGYGFWGTMLALLMHLIPTGVILIVLAISWRWEWVGGILFTALGALYLAMFWGRFDWSAYLLISGPLFLVGALFLINWLYRAELRTQRRDYEAQA